MEAKSHQCNGEWRYQQAWYKRRYPRAGQNRRAVKQALVIGTRWEKCRKCQPVMGQVEYYIAPNILQEEEYAPSKMKTIPTIGAALHQRVMRMWRKRRARHGNR